MCRPPVLCRPVDSDSRQACPLPDGSDGVLCPPAPEQTGRPQRHLYARPSALVAPPAASVDLWEAQWQVTQHVDALAELEERLSAVLHRPGEEQADMMDPLSEGAAADEDETLLQQLGRLGLQRLLTIQAIDNQTAL